MRRAAVVSLALLLSACGSTEQASAPKVSRMEPAAGGGMSYQEFRKHEANDGSDMMAVQKRFIIMDRDNNGSLSPAEFNGY